MDREDTLNTFAEGNTADGEGLVDAAVLTGKNDTVENLNTLFVAFANLGVNAHFVANFKGVAATAFLEVGLGGELDEGMVAHSFGSFFLSRSGRRRVVRSSCCSFRHFSIAAWLPPRRTGGTSRPS